MYEHRNLLQECIAKNDVKTILLKINMQEHNVSEWFD